MIGCVHLSGLKAAILRPQAGMVMRRDGSKSGSRAYSSLSRYGFPAPDLSDQSPVLFVDLLTRPRHQGEALREPRLRQHLRVSIILVTAHPFTQPVHDA